MKLANLLLAAILILSPACEGCKPAPRANRARVVATKSQLKIFEVAVKEFMLDTGRCPTRSEGLAALLQPPPALANSWKGPHLKKDEIPYDAWGNPLEPLTK